MKTRKIHYLSIIALFSIACDSFLDIDLAPQLIETGQLLSNENSAESAVNGVFTHMRTGGGWMSNGGATIYGGLVADEFQLSVSHPIYDAFFQNALLPNNSTVSASLWTPPYQTLYRCNVLIDALNTNPPLPNRTIDRLLGELLVVRALQFSLLAGFFGNVPIVTTSDYTINATLGQAKYEDVLGQALSDLQMARALLSAEGLEQTKVRPTYWAATALLARISLYAKNYSDAFRYASEIIEEGPFQLKTDLLGIFSIDSPETIWEIAPLQPTGNTFEGGAFLPSSASRHPTITLTNAVINAFEDGDQRSDKWIGVSTAGPVPVYYAQKYQHRQSGETFEHLVVLRLAEQYLIRAEARLMDGDEYGARNDLNVLRKRAEADILSDRIIGADLMQALRTERQCELFAEWGHRWIDLRRWGIIDNILAAEKPNWREEWALFPLPEEQLTYNYKLTQNPGY